MLATKSVLLTLVMLAQSYNVPFNPPPSGGGAAPIYNWVECTGDCATNIKFWWNGENCTQGTDCPQDDSSEYALDGTNEHSADVDGCTVGASADLNDPHIVNDSNGWTPMIEGSGQGVDADYNDGHAEYITCDNGNGSLTGETTTAAGVITGCMAILSEVDSVSATQYISGLTPSGDVLSFLTNAGVVKAVITGASTNVVLSHSASINTPYFYEFSYDLGSGADSIALYANGSLIDSDAATDVGVWDLGAGDDVRIGVQGTNAVDQRIDLMVIRSCSSGCSCADDSLWDEIAGTCSEGTTRCLTDADCTGTCGP